MHPYVVCEKCSWYNWSLVAYRTLNVDETIQSQQQIPSTFNSTDGASQRMQIPDSDESSCHVRTGANHQALQADSHDPAKHIAPQHSVPAAPVRHT